MLFQWIGRALERKGALANPTPELLELFGAQATAAGVAVNARTALRSPTTLACVRAISEAVGGLPIHVYRRGTNGERERDTDHPADALLNGAANPWTGAAEFRMGAQADALLHGAGFAQVVRANGMPRELHRLCDVKRECDAVTGEPSFVVSDGTGGTRTLPYADVLYLPTPGSVHGRLLCLVDLAREAIGVDLVMAQHNGAIFQNGARPSGIFTAKNKLSPEAIKNLKEAWQAAYAGGKNAGRVVFTELDADFRPITFNSVDSQFLELRRFSVEEIARVFKVPPTLVGDLERGTWRNIEELAQQFVTFTLMPWLEIWQTALARVLLSEDERKTHFIEFVIDDLVRADIAARFQAYRSAVGGSWLTPNEVRAFDNRAPVAGGDSLIRQAGQGDADTTGGESAN